MPLHFISDPLYVHIPLMNFNENREFHFVHDVDFFIIPGPSCPLIFIRCLFKSDNISSCLIFGKPRAVAHSKLSYLWVKK